MKNTSTLLLLALVASSLAGDLSAQSLGGSYKCIGSVILTTDNEVMPGSVVLTGAGAQSQVKSGNFYRERYFGLDSQGNKTSSDFVIDALNKAGVYARPDLYSECASFVEDQYSLNSFLQGFYPPTSLTKNQTLSDLYGAKLANGTTVTTPFNGYQYIPANIETIGSTIYYRLAGNLYCPASDTAIIRRTESADYQSLNTSTHEFYQSLADLLPTFPSYALNFDYAAKIYTTMKAYRNHDSNFASKVSDDMMTKAQLLADQLEWFISYDDANPASKVTIGGRSILGAIYNSFYSQTVLGTRHIDIFSAYYTNMYRLAAVMQLNKASSDFLGRPKDGSTYVWDLLKDSTGIKYVMFSFKNGTDSELTAYPMFGTGATAMAWETFENNCITYGITSLSGWCDACSSIADQCAASSTAYIYGTELQNQGLNLRSTLLNHKKFHIEKLSNVAAGGIGAGVTVAAIFLLELLCYMCYRIGTHKSTVNTVTQPRVGNSDNIIMVNNDNDSSGTLNGSMNNSKPSFDFGDCGSGCSGGDGGDGGD